MEGEAELTQVKLEDAGQGFHDIQHYLTSFNKELGSVPSDEYEQQLASQTTDAVFTLTDGENSTVVQSSASRLVFGHGLSGDNGSIMISSSNFQNEGGELRSVKSFEGDEVMTAQSPDMTTHVQVESSVTQPTAVDDQPTAADDQPTAVDDQPIFLGACGQYQTVAIVPTSKVDESGEVQYVLIVSQQDGGGDTQVKLDQDLSVYDFKEEKVQVTSEKDNKGLVRMVMGRPAQASGTQQHLMCNYCNYTSPKKYLLTRHLKTHSEERPHRCTECERCFKTINALQNHVNTHTGTRPHKCKECEASFTTSGELVRHTRYKHTFEKPHKCAQCNYASVELSKLKRHMRSHSGERPYQCPHCSYASPDTYKLKRHLRIHTGEKPYECDFCHARFTQSNSMKAHRLIHTGEKPVYQCELCPTTCGRKTDLKMHVLKLHTSQYPISCRKCGKSFPDRYTYKMHIETHKGEKCYQCEVCPYRAQSQRHLETHILTHTGEKPFTCQTCNVYFRQKQLLKRHMNLYHTPGYKPPEPKAKEFTCQECGKDFAHQGNLLRHMYMHDPENPMYSGLQLKEEVEEEMEEEMFSDDSEQDGHMTSSGRSALDHGHQLHTSTVTCGGQAGATVTCGGESGVGEEIYIQIHEAEDTETEQAVGGGVAEEMAELQGVTIVAGQPPAQQPVVTRTTLGQQRAASTSAPSTRPINNMFRVKVHHLPNPQGARAPQNIYYPGTDETQGGTVTVYPVSDTMATRVLQQTPSGAVQIVENQPETSTAQVIQASQPS